MLPRLFKNLSINHPKRTVCARLWRTFATDPSEPTSDDIQTVKNSLDMTDHKEKFWEYHQEYKGKVYSLKPIQVKCKSGKIYLWCSCGYSRTQPFCDGTHKVQHYKIKMKPVPFECKETKDYWFCCCKQSKHWPFCDGTHRELDPDKVLPTIRH
ncbi:uncharacterized protein LOC141854396 [Brevipalpus obovatus]|uniref:uncharacterized protein LOC141854396 n=1 Tax=Brevipalpus obovatus TaxID=246614 RepID=UPI003D9E3661